MKKQRTFVIRMAGDIAAPIVHLSTLDFSKAWAVEVKRYREKRSNDQNELYWLWLACIEDETGNSKESLAELFKQKFLGFTEQTVLGERVIEKLTTTTLNTKEFTVYLEKIRVFAAMELGISLPDPEDKRYQDFKDKYSNH